MCSGHSATHTILKPRSFSFSIIAKSNQGHWSIHPHHVIRWDSNADLRILRSMYRFPLAAAGHSSVLFSTSFLHPAESHNRRGFWKQPVGYFAQQSQTPPACSGNSFG